MSIESAIVTLLQADTGAGGVATLLTGGIYSKQAIGKMGLDVNNALTPTAYALSNQKYVLQPLLVVRVRSLVPTAQRSDVEEKIVGARGVAEFWFYDENLYTTITSARDRAYAVLQYETKASIGILRLDNRIEGLRAEELNDAALLRDDYSLTRRIGA
jgi:hypothetical protein